jgi:ATP-dependent Lhr-like helicase
VIEAHGRRLQHLDRFLVRHVDGLHDLLLSIGDLSRDEIRLRSEAGAGELIEHLIAERRAVEVEIAGERRLVAVEDAARYRDGAGVAIPALPAPLADPVKDALVGLAGRYARTHGPFTPQSVASRFGVPVSAVELALAELVRRERLVTGDLLPGGSTPEHCDVEVLRDLRRLSLSEARKAVEPKPLAALQRFLLEHHGIGEPRRGLDALLDAVDQLQGAPLLAADLEELILPMRIAGYQPSMLDELMAAGEVTWRGLERVGANDARIALYLTDRFEELAPPRTPAEGARAGEVRELIAAKGALFYSELLGRTKAFPPDLLEAIWALVFAGELTNDTLAPIRSLASNEPRTSARGRFRSRRLGPPGSEGRWSPLPDPARARTETERKTALARQLLARHGVLCRESIDAEAVSGGFASFYPILKAMEERGRVRRGWFVADLAATQFALPGADDRLRSVRGSLRPVVLAATDPASAYGAAIPWPDREGARPQRTGGAHVVLAGGELLGWLGPGGGSLLVFAAEDRAKELAGALRDFATGDRAVVIERIDGTPSLESPWSRHLEAAGFRRTGQGYLSR